MKILLIDDNVNITSMLSKYLKLKEIDCDISNDGRNGLELIKHGKYDAILLDISMPEVSGHDVINELEKTGKLKSNKIILFTASSITNDEIEKLKIRGVNACLKKPVQLQNLLDVLKN